MERIPRSIYTRELREEAVKLVTEGQFSILEVGYAMGPRMTKNLVSQSLFRGVAAKGSVAGLIHHSDRGSQYCSYEDRGLLDQFHMRASMSENGDCYDNAPMESGVRSRLSLSIIVAMGQEGRPSRRSVST